MISQVVERECVRARVCVRERERKRKREEGMNEGNGRNISNRKALGQEHNENSLNGGRMGEEKPYGSKAAWQVGGRKERNRG